jgi:hypothetical protein
MLSIAVLCSIAWFVSGILNANQAMRDGLIHPVPELGGIGYCVAVVAGPFGYRLLRG